MRLSLASHLVFLFLTVIAAQASDSRQGSDRSDSRQHSERSDSRQHEDRTVALDRRSFGEHAKNREIAVRDAVHHQPMTIDFGQKTLATAKPGDRIAIDGKPFTLTGLEHRRHNGALFAVDRHTFHENANSELSIKSAIDHLLLKINLRGKTLAQLKPGDEIDIGGKIHAVSRIDHNRYSTTFTTEQKIPDVSGMIGTGFIYATIFRAHQHKNNPGGG